MQFINHPLLAQAGVACPTEQWDNYWPDEIDASDAERHAAAQTWLWLQGLDADSDAGTKAIQSLAWPTFDAGLLVALSVPATKFLRWLSKVEEWEPFTNDNDNRPHGIDADAWGWHIVERARADVAALGALASQMPLRLEQTGYCVR